MTLVSNVDDALYDDLVADVQSVGQLGLATQRPELQLAGESILRYEARLIDQGRLSEWFELYTEDAIYWVPIDPDGGDPRVECCLSFDDRRRMGDRVQWLSSGRVHGEQPATRTRHQITNIEAFEVDDSTLRVLSDFTVFTYRMGRLRQFVGSYDHRLIKVQDDWRIQRKRVTLIDADGVHDNITIIF